MTTDAYNVAMSMLKHGCPFVCPECKEVRFNRKAIRDLVFIWPIPLPKFYIEGGVIARPETARNVEDEMYGRSDYGLVLSVGPGYWGDKKFHPTSDLSVGTKVAYDHFVPWGDFAPNVKGKESFIVICGFGDVKGIVN
jgi:hypothetical protein